MIHAGLMVAINTCGYDILALLVSIFISNLTHIHTFDRSRNIISRCTNTSDEHYTSSHSSTGRETCAAGGCIAIFIFVAYHSFVLAGSCASVLVLRHHLMLWAVFAPKVMFDVVCWIVYMVVAVLILIVVRRS